MKLFALILTVTTLIACSSNDDKEVTVEPRCLQDIINSILEEEVSNPKRTISSFNYNQQLIYAITPSSNVTEPATIIIDKSCNTICLIGGFAGDNGEAAGCEDFNNTSEFLETIWTDPR